MGPFKYGSRSDGEIQLAGIAAIEATLAGSDALIAQAHCALWSFWPQARFKVNTSSLLIGEHLEELEGADCALAHVRIVDYSLGVVKYYFDNLHIYFQSFRVLFTRPAWGSYRKTGDLPLDTKTRGSLLYWSFK
jgi:hypothetical protein